MVFVPYSYTLETSIPHTSTWSILGIASSACESEAQARPVARVRHKYGGMGASGLAEVLALHSPHSW